MPEENPQKRDFRQLRASQAARGPGHAIGSGFIWARDLIARGLMAVGITPNMVTVAGLGISAGTAVCLVIGATHVFPGSDAPESLPRSWWPLIVSITLFFVSATDMLDGALAHASGLKTRFGGVLDSFVDRGCDFFIYGGCAVHFALVGNLTLLVVALVGLCTAFLISYVKARAQIEGIKCDAGYWQRGERIAAFLIAGCAGHLPAAAWCMGVGGLLTAWRRIWYVRGQLSESGPPRPPGPLATSLMVWRHPRGSVRYDLATGTFIAFLIFGPWIWPFLYAATDPLGDWLRATL